jgi:four helix bundle suffix protein
MIQAARSGRQNIAEGSRAAAASSQTELRLLNVARSSLEELRLDYEDYLRHRHLPQWDPESPEALAVRRVPQNYRSASDQSDPSDLTDLTDQQRYSLYSRWLDHAEPAIRANTILCLINQANYLLDQQITALEEAFVNDGGYSEQLATARLSERERQRKAERSNSAALPPPSARIPACPRCSKPMVLRTAKTGKNSGHQFWGCSAYPGCKAVLSL